MDSSVTLFIDVYFACVYHKNDKTELSPIVECIAFSNRRISFSAPPCVRDFLSTLSKANLKSTKNAYICLYS